MTESISGRGLRGPHANGSELRASAGQRLRPAQFFELQYIDVVPSTVELDCRETERCLDRETMML